MFKLVRQLFASAALAGAALLPQAQAAVVTAVVDFEGDSLVGLYFPGDSLLQSGFVMTVNQDFGTIDTVGALDPSLAPTGNLTQFYFNSNDGSLSLTRDGGGLFNLDGFSAAFVSQPDRSQTTVIAAYGTRSDNSNFGVAWLYGSSLTDNHPFLAYGDPVDFSGFTDLIQVEFFSCAYDSAGICVTPTQNNGQFALDDIQLSFDAGTVPEPATLALMTIGLLGLGLGSLRRTV